MLDVEEEIVDMGGIVGARVLCSFLTHYFAG